MQKAQDVLGYRPWVPLETGLRLTIADYERGLRSQPAPVALVEVGQVR
jgi:hypothetical protein